MDKIDPTGGRKALLELLATQSQRTQKLAWQVAKETAAAIQSGTSAAQAVSTAMDRAGMAQAVRGNVAEAVVQSLCIGSGIWPKIEGRADIGRLKDIALLHTWDDSGMTLSTRLHGTNAAMRADIVGAVNSLVQARDNTWQASRKIYDGYGLGGAINRAKLSDLHGDLTSLLAKAQGTLTPESLADLKIRAKQLGEYANRLATGPLRASYLQFASRLEKGLTTGLDKLVKTATEEKARYHADRILRTEAARAWGQGFAKQCADDPDVIGWRWETSSAHKIFDICDFHARADLYGMGPGVYPKAHHPSYPAHPHCLCNASMVFKGEAPAPSDQVTKGGKDAIAGMTEAERVRILGKPGAQAFRGGADWKASIKLWAPPGGAGLSKGASAVLQAAIPAPQPKAFVKPASIADAETFIRSIGIDSSISGMSLDHAQEVAQALHKMVVTDGLPAVSGVRLDLRREGGAISVTGSDSTIMLGRAASRSGEWQSNRAKNNAAFRRAWDNWNSLSSEKKAELARFGQFEPTKRGNVSETIYDTVIHEYGHFIHSLQWGRKGQILQTDMPGFEEFIGRKPKRIPYNWKAQPRATDQKTVGQIHSVLSGYATTNGLETFAEAFVAKYSKGEALPKEWDRVIESAVASAKKP